MAMDTELNEQDSKPLVEAGVLDETAKSRKRARKE
jgi:hypothetical protein